MANNPYLYPMKYLLFYIISLLSLTACIHEELPPEDGFALEEGDPLPEFSISNPDGTVSVLIKNIEISSHISHCLFHALNFLYIYSIYLFPFIENFLISHNPRFNMECISRKVFIINKWYLKRYISNFNIYQWHLIEKLKYFIKWVVYKVRSSFSD